MKRLTFMLLAGEPSGDLLAAELVHALRALNAQYHAEHAANAQPLSGPFAPRFFGAGGPRMAGAGVNLVLDMTRHAVVGLVEVLRQYAQWRKRFDYLVHQALEQQPDVIVCVDFSGFNRRFAAAVRERIRERRGTFNNWRPRIIQYVSPQVWASRPGRAKTLERDLDLLLSIFPFERQWFARHAPRLRVEYVGHPILDRYAQRPPTAPLANPAFRHDPPRVLLLPGSRASELQRHLPVMLKAAALIETDWRSVQFSMVLPNPELEALAREIMNRLTALKRPRPHSGDQETPTVLLRRSGLRHMEIHNGNLADALEQTDAAIASTGTVTMECCYFGVPTVTLYKTSWSNFQIAKFLIQVNHLAMPNLLGQQAVFPELIQDAATPQNLAHETLELLEDADRRKQLRLQLRDIIQSLGPSGASHRAARAIFELGIGSSRNPKW